MRVRAAEMGLGRLVRGTVLVVDDEEMAARAHARVFKRIWPVKTVGLLSEARAFLASGETLSAAVLDVRLVDGRGTELVEPLRRRRPQPRILIVTAYDDADVIALAQMAGVEYLRKPALLEGFTAFGRRLALAEHLDSGRLCAAVELVAHEHELTIRETEILALAVELLTYDEIAERLGIDSETVKVHARSLAKKCHRGSLEQLAHVILVSIRE